MITLIPNRDTWRICLLAFVLAPPVAAQITQDHPELCGRGSSYVPLPSKVTASTSDVDSVLTIPLRDSTATIRMIAVEKVEQVCAIGTSRLLVFGTLADSSANDILLIDAITGVKLDEFWARNPAVSPDQHWLALREFYPAQSEVTTEQYMLYDLTKDAEGNKVPGADYPYAERLGRTMYPATQGHMPFQSNAVPPEQRHSYFGGSFLWAPDSKSLVFLDSTTAGTAIVLVRISTRDITTYIYSVSAEVCLSTPLRADFFPVSGDVPDVRIELKEPCAPLSLRSRDFRVATLEVHKPLPRKPTVLDRKLSQ